MTRPVRPVALVILTACALYPGLTFLYQGLYPFVAGEHFMLLGKVGPWIEFGQKFGLPAWMMPLAKAGLGAAWLAGVLGLWAGDGRAYPMVLAAALGSLLYPGGPMIPAALALVCLFFFREDPTRIPA